MKTPEQIGAQVLATLKAQAARNRQAAAVLREQIRAVLAQHPEPARLSASAVRALLWLEPRPSLRTVQEHLRTIRTDSGISVRGTQHGVDPEDER